MQTIDDIMFVFTITLPLHCITFYTNEKDSYLLYICIKEIPSLKENQ